MLGRWAEWGSGGRLTPSLLCPSNHALSCRTPWFWCFGSPFVLGTLWKLKVLYLVIICWFFTVAVPLVTKVLFFSLILFFFSEKELVEPTEGVDAFQSVLFQTVLNQNTLLLWYFKYCKKKKYCSSFLIKVNTSKCMKNCMQLTFAEDSSARQAP